MAEFAYPTQNRYNDPYQQRVDIPESVYPQKYLSRVANNFLRSFGNNMIVYGLEATPITAGSGISVSYTPGMFVHDLTLVEFATSNTLTCDVATLGDTPTTGSYLGVFTDFKYFETPDLDAQSALKLSIYHIDSTGLTVTPFTGSPVFDTNRNKILVSVINFTKSGTNVTSCTDISAEFADGSSQIKSVMGTTYYLRGYSVVNVYLDMCFRQQRELINRLLSEDYLCF